MLDARLDDLDDLHGEAGLRNLQAELDWDAVLSALPLNGLYEARYPETHAFIVKAQARAEEVV